MFTSGFLSVTQKRCMLKHPVVVSNKLPFYVWNVNKVMKPEVCCYIFIISNCNKTLVIGYQAAHLFVHLVLYLWEGKGVANHKAIALRVCPRRTSTNDTLVFVFVLFCFFFFQFLHRSARWYTNGTLEPMRGISPFYVIPQHQELCLCSFMSHRGCRHWRVLYNGTYEL